MAVSSVRVGKLSGLLASALDVLLPPLCRNCCEVADSVDFRGLLCRGCAATLSVIDAPIPLGPSFAAAHAYCEFDSAARRLLIDLKYDGLLRAGAVLGARMAASPAAAPILRGADLIVPVPLHWRRRWRRGHNQAAVIAGALARKHRRAHRLRVAPAPAAVNVLRRVRSTPPQVGLARGQRLVNVDAAFRLRRRFAERCRGATVVLVDDVVTTGATAEAAASTLLAGGVAEVRLYAAAIAPL